MADSTRSTTRRDSKKTAQLVVIIAAAALLIWFVIGNARQVKVEFWVTSAQTSLIAVILVSAALGALIALLMARGRHRK